MPPARQSGQWHTFKHLNATLLHNFSKRFSPNPAFLNLGLTLETRYRYSGLDLVLDIELTIVKNRNFDEQFDVYPQFQ